MAKKNIKVRDLKPRKDAKGGGGVNLDARAQDARMQDARVQDARVQDARVQDGKTSF